MKRLIILMICCVPAIVAISAQAVNGDKGKGEALFNDPSLAGSSNTKSCRSCHEDGDLDEGGERKDLKKVINMCISKPLAGKPLSDDSREMLDLEAYIKSLGE